MNTDLAAVLASGDPPEDGPLIEVIFGDDELARLGPMHRSTGQGTFSAFVHDLAMQAVADWEAKQAAEPATVTAAD